MSNFTRVVAPPYHFDHDGAPLFSYLLAQHRKRVIDYVSTEPELNYDKNSKVGPSVQHIQNILDNTDFMLRMYGSASELSENLKIYRNFLGNSEYFQDDAVSYCTTPTIYLSLKNEEYICKSDLFPYLQNLTIFTHKELSEDLFLPFITVYLKSKEKSMIGKDSMEFIRFKPEVFEEIEKEFGRRMEIFGKTLNNETHPISTILTVNYSADQIFEKLKKLVPGEWTKCQMERVKEIIGRMYGKIKEIDRKKVFDWLYFNLKNLMETYEFIVGNWAELFGKKKPTNGPKMIRLFEDGDYRFAILSEVSHAASIKFIDNGGFSHDLLNLQQIQSLIKEKFNTSIEFIRCPIRRAKHKAVPIKAPNGFAVLAVDALFDVLRNVIFGSKLFQNGKKIEEIVSALFKELEQGFITTKDPYLVKLEECNELIDNLTSQLAPLAHKNLIANMKDVRNAKKDGFTVENLRNELRHLNLTEMFPEILDYAGIVYEWVDKKKKEEVLRTCDLFDAVEMCQLICIFNKLPNLKNFLCSQNACGRVLTLNCYSCKADGKNTSATVPLTPTVPPSESPNPPPEVVQEFLVMRNPNTTRRPLNNSEIQAILNAVSSGEIRKKNSVKTAPESSKSTSSGVVSEQKSGKKAPEKDSKKGKASEGIQKATLASEKPKSAPDSAKNQKATSSSLDSESPVAEVALKPKKNQKKAPESAKNQKSSSEAPPPPKKESANCVKCYRTCEMLNETKKELKSTQNKLAMYEKKNLEMDKEKKKKNERILEEQEEKIAKLQKGLEAKNQEIEELNKGIEKKALEIKAKRVENEKILERKRMELEGMAKEIWNLKKIISNSTDISHENLELKKEISSLQNSNSSQKQSFLAEKSKLLERMGILETENHTLKQRSKELGGARILERTRENQRVHVGILKLKTENRTKERVIQQLMDRLANSVPIATMTTTSGIQNPNLQNPHQNPNPEDVTPPYQQQYPDFETAQYPDAAPEAWDPYAPEFFPTSSESPFFLNNFCKVTSSRMTPDAPEFIPASRSIQTATPWFDAISSESATSSSSSSAAAPQNSEKSESATDSECPICLDEVASNEKKINCHQCKKRFHSHCASTWLRVKSECPACRGRLLDPNEFPTLS